jgi:hypothetical protein
MAEGCVPAALGRLAAPHLRHKEVARNAGARIVATMAVAEPQAMAARSIVTRPLVVKPLTRNRRALPHATDTRKL